jgi:hypothetical protein
VVRQWRLLDATPVPCGQSRETVKRSALAGWAGYGYDTSHHRFYWGLKLYVLAAPDGLPAAWCLANPDQGEREVAEGLSDRAARQGVLRPGMVVLADKGLAGHQFEGVVGELGATLARPDRADEPYRFGSLGGVRQWVEAIFDTLKDQLGLERTAPTPSKACSPHPQRPAPAPRLLEGARARPHPKDAAVGWGATPARSRLRLLAVGGRRGVPAVVAGRHRRSGAAIGATVSRVGDRPGND